MRLKSLVAAIVLCLMVYVSVFAQSGTPGTILKDANLRAGPGTSFAIAGAAKAGQAVTIVGKNDDGDWYQLDSKAWVAAFLVDINDNSTALPTAKPLATKSPTFTPSPTVDGQTNQINIHNDPAAKTYGDGLRKALGYYADGSKIVSLHSTQAGATPSLMFDKTWQGGMILGLSELKLCSQAIRKLTPPSYLIDMHADLLLLADHLDSAVKLWADGFDTLDSTKIKKGTSEFILTGTFAQSANEKMTTLLGANTPTPQAVLPVSTPKPGLTLTPLATATTKSVAVATATVELAWYSGGTLHAATVDEWNAADDRNKLATAADWAYVGFDNVHFSTPDEIRPYAEQVVICVNESLDGSVDMGNSATAVANLCIAIMKDK